MLYLGIMCKGCAQEDRKEVFRLSCLEENVGLVGSKGVKESVALFGGGSFMMAS